MRTFHRHPIKFPHARSAYKPGGRTESGSTPKTTRDETRRAALEHPRLLWRLLSKPRSPPPSYSWFVLPYEIHHRGTEENTEIGISDWIRMVGRHDCRA